MEPWMIILLVVGSLVLAVGVGYGIYKLYDKVDDSVDEKQKQIMKLCMKFSQYGVDGWFVDLLADMVAGDEESLYRRLQEMYTADNTTAFFEEKLALPIYKYMKAKYEQEKPAVTSTVAPVAPIAKTA
jgi:hypothetical protein